MKPVGFKEQNVVLIADGCEGLPAHKGENEIISCWKGTISERVKFLFTGTVWFSVKGRTQPPVWIGADYPFEEVAK